MDILICYIFIINKKIKFRNFGKLKSCFELELEIEQVDVFIT